MGIALLILAISWISQAIVSAFDGVSDNGLVDTVGEIRNKTLAKLTAEYRSERPSGDIIVLEGQRLAPIDYMNGELRDMNASWRVQIENGQLDFKEVT